MIARPRNQRFLRKQGTQNPGFRKDVGVFLVRGEPQDRGQVTAQRDDQLFRVGQEGHLIDQGAEDPWLRPYAFGSNPPYAM